MREIADARNPALQIFKTTLGVSLIVAYRYDLAGGAHAGPDALGQIQNGYFVRPADIDDLAYRIASGYRSNHSIASTQSPILTGIARLAPVSRTPEWLVLGIPPSPLFLLWEGKWLPTC
jgi:hypothetical protein